jgi:hypothetical protein
MAGTRNRTLFVAVAVLLTGVLAIGLLSDSPKVQRRKELVAKKLRGELTGIGWMEIGVRLAPGTLGLRRLVNPGPSHFAYDLDVPLEHDEIWKYYEIYRGRTRCIDSFDIHLSVLRAGEIPHELHQHQAEELILPVSGAFDVVRADDGDGSGRLTERVDAGKFIYHAGNDWHTVYAPGPSPSSYLVFKWDSETEPRARKDALGSATVVFDSDASARQARAGWKVRPIFDAPTELLSGLHAHLSRLEPGAGYPAHEDDYDVGIFLMEGTVETVGRRVSAPSVIFYSAHKPHGMHNPGPDPAKYVVFEFHGCDAAG